MIRISESKGAMNLKTFSGNKGEFQEWLDKLVNQFTVVHQGSRDIFKSLAVDVNKKKGLLTSGELSDIFKQHGSKMSSTREIMEEDLHYILTDKTSGEAKSKVDIAEHGKGIEALMNLIMWYSTSSGEAIDERTKKIMNPGTP